MLLSAAITPQTLLSNPNLNNNNYSHHHCNLLFCPNTLHLTSSTTSTHHRLPPPPLALSATASSAFANGTSENSLQNPNNGDSIRHVSNSTCLDDDDEPEDMLDSSASALAAAIRKASTSPVQFTQRRVEDKDKDGVKNPKSQLVLPSTDFQMLCLDQLHLFRRIVNPDALLSVYVRPAGSYVMDRLELRRVTFYPSRNSAEIVILICNFSVTAGLRVAEAALSNQQAEFVPESRAVVFPMVKHPFVVGFLVAELPKLELEGEGHDVKQCPLPKESYASPPFTGSKSWEIQSFKDSQLEMYKFTAEQRLNAINISRSIAMAYVMDQKAMLLQQSSWQNNVRMNNLVEQIRGPLSSIRTLSKMLSVHMKRSEISYDIVEDILVQGDRMRDTLQQLQDAVYLTKSNIVRYNEETLMKMHHSTHTHPESSRSQLSNFSEETPSGKMQESGGPFSLTSASKDLELPMPPLALAPLQQQDIRPCNVSDVLGDLVGALEPLAQKQHRGVELHELSESLEVAVEEPSLRQAFSNLIEGALLRTQVGGKVEIFSAQAPAGGALVIIDDDGPDMHYMTQTHTLTPFGEDLLSSEDMVEDNMTWNFVAGLTVAREILESYGCVIRVISPRSRDAPIGAGGTRVELWLPFSSSPGHDQQV